MRPITNYEKREQRKLLMSKVVRFVNKKSAQRKLLSTLKYWAITGFVILLAYYLVRILW